MDKSFVFCCILIMVMSVSCGRETEDHALVLIREGVKVMGGEKALQGIETIVRKGRIKAIAPDGGHEGNIVISIRKDPPGICIQQTFGTDEIIQAYDGEESWNRSPFSPVKATPEFNDFYRIYALLHAGGAVIGLRDGVELTLGKEEEGETAGSVTVLLDKNTRIVLSFDQNTGFLTEVTFGMLPASEGEDVLYSITYHGYKKIGTLRLPHLWKCYLDNDLIAEIDFSEITLNPPLDDSLFRRPDQETPAEPDGGNSMPQPDTGSERS